MDPIKKQENRNQKLIRAYQSGKFSLVDLVSEFKISSVRIYQILDSYNIPRLNPRRKKSHDRPKKVE
jgi:hypothetical protein